MAKKSIENSIESNEEVIRDLEKNMPRFFDSYEKEGDLIYMKINTFYNQIKDHQYSTNTFHKPNQELRGFLKTVVEWEKEINYLRYISEIFSYNYHNPEVEFEETLDYNLKHFNNKISTNLYDKDTLKEDSLYETTLKKTREFLLKYEGNPNMNDFPRNRRLEVPFEINSIFKNEK